MIRNNSVILCSLVEVNLNYVNTEWSNWFSGRYILVRYEDTTNDLLHTIFKIYNFTGLRMVTSINNWILEGKQSPGVKNRYPAFSVSKNDVKRIALFTVTFSHLHYNVFEHGCEAISGNFDLLARNCLTSTFKNIVMQMRKVNCEKGY